LTTTVPTLCFRSSRQTRTRLLSARAASGARPYVGCTRAQSGRQVLAASMRARHYGCSASPPRRASTSAPRGRIRALWVNSRASDCASLPIAEAYGARGSVLTSGRSS
jgi:hypothetical protein